MLRKLMMVYTINTHCWIEQQPDSTPITTPFQFAPARTTNVTPDHHILLIPPHNTLFNEPPCSYNSAPSEDVNMTSKPPVSKTTNS